METVLKTEGLTKAFSKKTVVNEISMTIRRGDIYGFIGKNGAGKTTFMRLILGLAIPDKGTVSLFEGEDRRTAGAKIGSMIEAPALYTGCTALENLRRFSIISNGVKGAGKKDDKELTELLELVGLQDTGKKAAGHFSLGMKQRLGLAIALLGDPEFLVMDEPVNGLDPAGIKSIRDTIRTLNQEKGVTFLISSHLLDELSKTVTRYGIINNGVLVEEIDKQALDEQFRRNITITVDNPLKAASILQGMIPEKDLVVNGDVLTVYSHQYEAAALNRTLVQAGLQVSGLNTHVNDIETFFLERIGE